MANAKGLSLRGGQRPTWQSRSSRLHRGKVTGEIATAFPRLPRRFAPRNDTSGQRSNGNGAAHRIGGTTAASRTGLAVPAPTGPVRIERRPVRIGNAFPRLPRRFAPRNDTSGGYCGAPAPSSGLIPLCKALNERRYRRNRSVRFYRHLVRTGSAFPRLPRPLWGLAMTRQGSAAMGTVRHTASAVLLPLRGRAWLSPPLQGQCGLNDGRRMIHSSFFSIHYSLFIISSIPLRGMANHMTKRPEIPCLSCKFPQSRRICH